MKKLLAILFSAVTLAASSAMTVFAEPATDTQTPPISNIIFAQDDDTDINGGLLTPGEEYRFLLQYTTAGSGDKVDTGASDFTDTQMNGSKFLIETRMGRSSMESFKIAKSGGKYYLIAKPRAVYPTEQNDVEYKIRLVNSKSGDVLHEKTVAFRVGFPTISDDELFSASVEEPIYITNDAPVITEQQFEDINFYTSGKAATFTNGDWSINVRVGGLKDRNLYSTAEGIPEIETRFEDNLFRFISFPANPRFDYTAKVTVDVSNEFDAFDDKFVLYRYEDGVLTHMPSEYDHDSAQVTFSTKELGTFVLTNVALGNSANVGGSTGNNNTNTPEPNPETGTNAPLSLAFAAVLVSLTAGAAAMKRK